jgi:ABC-2 type transport system ATP-binding protein
MAVVLAAVAEESLSVIFSSHVVSELERVADYLILMSLGRVQMVGMIDDLLARHVVLSGPTDDAERVAELFVVIQSQHAGRQSQFVARTGASTEIPRGWVAESISLDELVLAYLREPSATAMTGPLAISANRAGG